MAPFWGSASNANEIGATYMQAHLLTIPLMGSFVGRAYGIGNLPKSFEHLLLEDGALLKSPKDLLETLKHLLKARKDLLQYLNDPLNPLERLLQDLTHSRASFKQLRPSQRPLTTT